MKKGKSKKWLKWLILLAIVGAIIVGIVLFFKNRKPKEVPVFPVNNIGGEDYWEEESSSQGSIKEDKMQSVYVSKTQKVEKILVKEGQAVKEGDVLLTYNTTLSNLELERKQLDIKKLEIDLDKAQKELAKIQTYQPDVPIYGKLPEERPIVEETAPTLPTLPDLTPPLPTVTPENETSPAPLTGEGTNEKPYLFIWSENKEYEKAFIQSLISRAGSDKTEVIAIFMIRENGSLTGNLQTASKIKFTKKENDYAFSILQTYTLENDPLYPNGANSEENTPDETQPQEPLPEVGPIYTATELKRMVMEKENEISEISLNIKIAKNEYKKQKSELENTTVYSKLDGVIKNVLSVEDENLSTKPILVVSSGGGYLVQGRVGEFDLDNIKIGQKVEVRSFESGTSAEGTVEKISDYPLSGSYYNGMGNSNVSYYPYTLRIGEDANFKEGEYVMLKLVSEHEKTSSFYITSAFILSESGKNYAYVAGENNKLEKREVKVGKNRYGMMEIRGRNYNGRPNCVSLWEND